MNKKLTNNLLLKILSFVFAFALWLVVVNINDPDKTRIISGIPITIVNEEKITEQGLGQVYYIDYPTNQYGAVMVKGAKSIVDDLTGKDITATVDFSDVSSVGAVTINYSFPDGVSLVTKRVETMRITVEAMKEDTFNVQIDTTGTTADGYTLGDGKISPSRVKITAPETILDSIKQVELQVDVDGMSTDIATQEKLHLYDGNGKEIFYEENPNITISASTLAVNITMFRTQNKELKLETTGEVQEGYRFLGVNCDVAGVAVKGLPGTVLGFTNIAVTAASGSLDISELTEPTEVILDLEDYLPAGISLVNEADRYVTVLLNVQPLVEKELYIPLGGVAVRNIPENMDVIFDETATVVVTLEGLAAELDPLQVSALEPEIDLTGLGEGVHHMTIELEIPEGVRQLNSADMYITLSVRVEETVPEETSSQVSETTGESKSESDTESSGLESGSA